MSDRPIAAIGETLLLPEHTTSKSITDSVSRVNDLTAIKKTDSYLIPRNVNQYFAIHCTLRSIGRTQPPFHP